MSRNGRLKLIIVIEEPLSDVETERQMREKLNKRFYVLRAVTFLC